MAANSQPQRLFTRGWWGRKSPVQSITRVPAADPTKGDPGERLLQLDGTVTVAYASETGFVEDLADRIERDLVSAGIAVQLMELDDLDAETLRDTSPILFMVSTTGDGDPPFIARDFDADVMAAPLDLSQLRFGLLSAGDSSYDTFCGFGHRLCQWLQASGACPLFEPVYVDCEDGRAVRQWRRSVVRALT